MPDAVCINFWQYSGWQFNYLCYITKVPYNKCFTAVGDRRTVYRQLRALPICQEHGFREGFTYGSQKKSELLETISNPPPIKVHEIQPMSAYHCNTSHLYG